MQQENEGLSPEQLREANLDKLLTKVEKLGWPEMKPQVNEAFAHGLAEFEILGSKRFGESALEVSFHFGPGKKNENTIYLNEMEALLIRPVPVMHQTIDGFSTQHVEDLVQSLPKDAYGTIVMKDLKPMDELNLQNLQQSMQWLMEKAPDVFNALVVKYNPPLDFEVSGALKNKQEHLQRDTVRYNKVSSYFNLSALELFNAMDGGYPLKKLFVNKDNENTIAQRPASQQPTSAAAQPGEVESNSRKRQFEAYIKMNFSVRHADGTSPIELIAANRLHIGKEIMEFNFEEMQSRHNRSTIMQFLEKGSKVEFTNLNKAGEHKVIVSTNPEYSTLDLRKQNGAIIYDKKAYLKNPMSIQVGAVVSLHKEGIVPKTASTPPEVKTVEQLAARFAQVRQLPQGAEQGLTPGITAAPPPGPGGAADPGGQQPGGSGEQPIDASKSNGQPPNTASDLPPKTEMIGPGGSSADQTARDQALKDQTGDVKKNGQAEGADTSQKVREPLKEQQQDKQQGQAGEKKESKPVAYRPRKNERNVEDKETKQGMAP